MKRILLFGAILLGLTACGEQATTIDLYAYKDHEIDYFSLIDTASYRVVKLETTENSLVGEISKVEVVGDQIIVLHGSDSKSVFVFDLDGRFIRPIGHQGRGPGEYVRAANFVIDYDANQIIVTDDRGHKQLFYDLSDGRFVKEYQMISRPMAYIDGRYFFQSIPMDTPEHYEVVEVDTANQIIGGYYPREKFVEKSDAGYSGNFRFYQHGRDFYFIPLYTDELYLLTNDGIELKHRFGFGDRAADYDGALTFFDVTTSDYKFHHITDFAITDDLNYYFEVGYGKDASFIVYGNLNSGRVEATTTTLFFKNPSVTPKILLSMGIIGSYRDQFINVFSSPYLLKERLPELFGDATENDNPCLIFFKVKNLD
ncbi:MAG: 6-bladed beta-propeller [Rikenellaceae bacterium]|jgi:hypothetical protein|nr:6-bladed beta-propeller [Rikenellaceae bacterium]